MVTAHNVTTKKDIVKPLQYIQETSGQQFLTVGVECLSVAPWISTHWSVSQGSAPEAGCGTRNEGGVTLCLHNNL